MRHLVLWLQSWWYRLTYCRKHDHHYSAYGFECDDYCGNCGRKRR